MFIPQHVSWGFAVSLVVQDFFYQQWLIKGIVGIVH